MGLIGLEQREKHKVGDARGSLEIFGGRVLQGNVEHERSISLTTTTFDGGIINRSAGSDCVAVHASRGGMV